MRTEILIVHPADDSDSNEERLPLGRVDEVKAALRSSFGPGTWETPFEGFFQGDAFSVVARLGTFPILESLTLEVEGDALAEIRELCLLREWQAFDLESGETITDLGGV